MRRAWPVLLLEALAVGGAAVAQGAFDPAAVDAFVMEQMRAQGVPGMALALVRGGEVVHVRGYGRSGDGAEVTPRTRFLVASLSKSFTALAVLQLAHDGRVDLDAPVRRYLPGFTLADPDVAARLVEVVSGEPFGRYLEERVFGPLGMEDTVSVTSSDDLRRGVDGLARGHVLAYGVPVPSGEEAGFLAGHAGVVTTAADMGRYLAVIASGGRLGGEQVVPAEVLAPWLSPVGSEGYALGWFVGERGGERLLQHNGILSTFAADAVVLPQRGDAFVLLYDVHGVAQDLFGFPRIREGVLSLALGGAAASGGFGVRHWAALFAALTVAAVALGVRGLLAAPDWARWSGDVPLWRALAGAARWLLPLAVLLAVPAIGVASTGRYFPLLTLYRSAIGVMTWLGLAALLGAANALLRAATLLRRG